MANVVCSPRTEKIVDPHGDWLKGFDHDTMHCTMLSISAQINRTRRVLMLRSYLTLHYTTQDCYTFMQLNSSSTSPLDNGISLVVVGNFSVIE